MVKEDIIEQSTLRTIATLVPTCTYTILTTCYAWYSCYLLISTNIVKKNAYTITGDHSYQDQMLLVKTVKYIRFYVYHRSYWLWSPVIVQIYWVAPPNRTPTRNVLVLEYNPYFNTFMWSYRRQSRNSTRCGQNWHDVHRYTYMHARTQQRRPSDDSDRSVDSPRSSRSLPPSPMPSTPSIMGSGSYIGVSRQLG